MGKRVSSDEETPDREPLSSLLCPAAGLRNMASTRYMRLPCRMSSAKTTENDVIFPVLFFKISYLFNH